MVVVVLRATEIFPVESLRDDIGWMAEQTLPVKAREGNWTGSPAVHLETQYRYPRGPLPTT